MNPGAGDGGEACLSFTDAKTGFVATAGAPAAGTQMSEAGSHGTLDPMLDPRQVAPERLRPLRRREFDRLVELGCFEDEQVELLRGALVSMTPQKPPHADVVSRLAHRLILVLGERALVRAQAPFAASDYSEPEPDLAVVPMRSYRDAHPNEAFLLIEVADSSLSKDRKVKSGIYAACGVPEYWIVNLVDNLVEVHRDPAGESYRQVERLGPGQTLSPAAFPDIVLPVDTIL